MKRIIIIISVALALCSCGPKLVIIHTNDTHSHLEPIRSGEFDGRGGAIERAAFVDSIRAEVGEDRVLLVHAGDFSQGSSYFSCLGGEAEDAVLNAMRYDVVTLGNHELDNGLEDLTERVKRISCPVVCANLDLSSFELGEYVKPYTILRRGKMKIGVIGLEAKLDGNVSRLISSRIPVLDPVEESNKWAEYLKKTEKCDFVMILSHRGWNADLEQAAASRNVDLIIGGHSHTRIDGIECVMDLDGKDVRVATDWLWGLEMGKVEIR